MPGPLQPTVRQLPPIRQLIAGAAIAGAVAVAVPATASAASTCEYNTSNKNVLIDDRSGPNPLRIVRAGDLIAFSDGPGAPRFCTVPDQSGVATVNNTERIAIFRAGNDMSGGVNVDLSGGPLAPGAIPETDGQSEVEVQISDTGKISDPMDFTNALTVTGSLQADIITASRNGHVNFGTDADIDIRTFKPLEAIVKAGAGDDILFAGGPVPAPPPGFRLEAVTLNGQGGKDTVVGSSEFNRLIGGDGDDRLYSVDTGNDSVFGDEPVGGQPGSNDFATVDIFDRLVGVESFFVTSGGIGELALTPEALTVESGRVADMQMSWKHPKAWKALRAIKLQVFRGTEKVGRVVVRPATGKVTAHGALKLARGSKMGHKGSTVNAKLALRLPKSLAGQTLSVDVAATDDKGRTQVEPAAALITVSS
jgi:hypothetical protein